MDPMYFNSDNAHCAIQRKERIMERIPESRIDRRLFLKTALLGSAVAAGALAGWPLSVHGAAPYSLSPLPYPENGLEPHISSRTVGFHYGKHHKGYVDKTNELARSAGLEGLSLVELVKRAAAAGNEPLFNNAAQVWNHDFYWRGMKPQGGGSPSGDLEKAIMRSFGSVEDFKRRFSAAAEGRFGSGYAWLVARGDTLDVLNTINADTPLVHGMKPLLTIDVWEHAYYLDYQNRRKDHIQAFLDHLVNWEFVSRNLRST
jgi:Fe-Mn family superoxide dismutase